MAKANINGTRHAWGSIKLMLLGREVTGISEISYKDSTSKENHYGQGGMPVSRGTGQYKAEATIKLDKYEVQAIQTATGGKRLQDIDPFDIIVTYMPVGQDKLQVDVIRNCEFTTNERTTKSGDTTIGVPLPLIISHIVWHGQTEV